MAGAIPLVVNGVITDWSRTEFCLAKKKPGVPPMRPIRGGFTKFDFDYGIEGRENRLGNAMEPVGQNQGSMGYKASLGMFEACWMKILTYLGDGFLLVENQLVWTCSYRIESVMHHVSVEGSIIKPAASWSQGNVHMRDLELLPLSIREPDNNGNLIKPVG